MFVASSQRTMQGAKRIVGEQKPAVRVYALPAKPRPTKLPFPRWVEDIVYEAAEDHDVTVDEILSGSRILSVIDARAEVFYRLNAHGTIPARIGQWFGRNRLSVCNLVARHADQHGLRKLTGYDRDLKNERAKRWYVDHPRPRSLRSL